MNKRLTDMLVARKLVTAEVLAQEVQPPQGMAGKHLIDWTLA